MPKFAASVSWLFQEVPLLERFEQAALAGFRAVEVQSPYEEPAEALAAELKRHNLEAVLLNVQPALAAIRQCVNASGIATDPANVALVDLVGATYSLDVRLKVAECAKTKLAAPGGGS